jgi:hypothetical protein
VINITAIMATIILARRGNRICPYHLKRALAARDQIRDSETYRLKRRHYVANTNN